jgi:hypothetical protein
MPEHTNFSQLQVRFNFTQLQVTFSTLLKVCANACEAGRASVRDSEKLSILNMCIPHTYLTQLSNFTLLQIQPTNTNNKALLCRFGTRMPLCSSYSVKRDLLQCQKRPTLRT